MTETAWNQILKSLNNSAAFQAEYEGSIPSTRSRFPTRFSNNQQAPSLSRASVTALSGLNKLSLGGVNLEQTGGESVSRAHRFSLRSSMVADPGRSSLAVIRMVFRLFRAQDFYLRNQSESLMSR